VRINTYELTHAVDAPEDYSIEQELDCGLMMHGSGAALVAAVAEIAKESPVQVSVRTDL
jgi:tmRNA-binding protein